MSVLERLAHGLLGLACVSFLASASTAPGSHLWVVNEIFSSPDGSVQFVELKECCGSPIEHAIAGKDVYSNSTNYTFPTDINPLASTADKHLLLGTSAFAALPGAPTPDYVIPENFFSIQGDVIRWHIYPAATLTFGPGDLPQDGVSSLNQDLTTAANSPTNFFNQTGQVQVAAGPMTPVPAAPPWALALLASVFLGLGTFVLSRRG